MFKKQAFTVSIGSSGVVVALHQGRNVVHKILVAELNDESKAELEKLFTSNSSAPIYILLDNTDQNYKKKTYPPVSRKDLNNIISRDLKKEAGDSGKIIKNYLTHKDKKTKKWECVLIFSTHSEEIETWINFLMQLPGKVVGIYMLPVETQILSNLILNATLEKKSADKKLVTFFIIQNKVSGVRQIIFSDHTIIFSRLVNYQFEHPKFASEFEQDIFRTNEYLKRIFPELKIEDINIVNILPQEVINKIDEIKNPHLKFINYTPFNAAEKIGLSHLITENSNFSDVLVSNVFVNSKKKILRFSTPKIKMLEKIYLVINSILFINASTLLVILGLIINIFIYGRLVDKEVSEIMSKKTAAEQVFKKAKSMAFDDEDTDSSNLPIDEIMDFGKINDALGKSGVDIFELYNKMKLSSSFGATVKSFGFNLPGYNPKNSRVPPPRLIISGAIKTPSGDVEDLFKQYDGLSLATKNAFPEYNVSYSDLPKDIDFSKKYYNFSYDLTISGR